MLPGGRARPSGVIGPEVAPRRQRASGRRTTVACVSTGLAPDEIRQADWSVAMLTRYFVAYVTGDQRRTSGCDGHATARRVGGQQLRAPTVHALTSLPRLRPPADLVLGGDPAHAPEVDAVGDRLVERRGGAARAEVALGKASCRSAIERNLSSAASWNWYCAALLTDAPRERRQRLDRRVRLRGPELRGAERGGVRSRGEAQRERTTAMPANRPMPQPPRTGASMARPLTCSPPRFV